MPLVEKIKPFLWEVRSRVPNGIARVLFTVDGNIMILLHGFIKKSQKIPKNELKTALKRILAYQIRQEMELCNISKTALAKMMKTSRSSVDRLLDPKNSSITLLTLERVAVALGKKLKLQFA